MSQVPTVPQPFIQKSAQWNVPLAPPTVLIVQITQMTVSLAIIRILFTSMSVWLLVQMAPFKPALLVKSVTLTVRPVQDQRLRVCHAI